MQTLSSRYGSPLPTDNHVVEMTFGDSNLPGVIMRAGGNAFHRRGNLWIANCQVHMGNGSEHWGIVQGTSCEHEDETRKGWFPSEGLWKQIFLFVAPELVYGQANYPGAIASLSELISRGQSGEEGFQSYADPGSIHFCPQAEMMLDLAERPAQDGWYRVHSLTSHHAQDNVITIQRRMMPGDFEDWYYLPPSTSEQIIPFPGRDR